MEKAFEPFYTTKDVGKGTGLGLSQVYGFIKQSGGHIKIYSEPGQGTTVKIYLPRYFGDLQAERPVDHFVARASGESRAILVVDDDPDVLKATELLLLELGYKVYSAGNADDALRTLEERPEIELLFTDVVMPKVNGRALATEAQTKNPRLKVVYTTGFSRNAIIHNGVLDPNVELLPKPFTLEELARKLEAAFLSAG